MSDSGSLGELAKFGSILQGEIAHNSRIILIANNREVPDEYFNTLDIKGEDIVVLFNTPIHSRWALAAKKILIFQNNHLSSAWGFQKSGCPEPEVAEILNYGEGLIAAVFSQFCPASIATNLPLELPVVGIPGSAFISFYPNRGASRTASIGFYGYMLLRHVCEQRGIRNPIYLVGFSGKFERAGAIVSHDWFYETGIIDQDRSSIKVYSGGGLSRIALGEREDKPKVLAPARTENPVEKLSADDIRNLAARCRVRQDVVRFARKGGVGVELGVAEGEFSERVLQMDWLSYLYSVDMYDGDRGHDINQYTRAIRRLGRFKERNSLIKMRFEQAAHVFDDLSLDFVYVDGYAHTGEDDGKHFPIWWKKLRTGGILAGDDYSRDWPKVIESVNRFAVEKGVEIFVIDCKEVGSTWSRSPSWFAIKKN